MPNDFVKILGVIFDDRLNLEKHINGVVSTCYANLRNLGRITYCYTNLRNLGRITPIYVI